MQGVKVQLTWMVTQTVEATIVQAKWIVTQELNRANTIEVRVQIVTLCLVGLPYINCISSVWLVCKDVLIVLRFWHMCFMYISTAALDVLMYMLSLFMYMYVIYVYLDSCSRCAYFWHERARVQRQDLCFCLCPSFYCYLSDEWQLFIHHLWH